MLRLPNRPTIAMPDRGLGLDYKFPANQGSNLQSRKLQLRYRLAFANHLRFKRSFRFLRSRTRALEVSQRNGTTCTRILQLHPATLNFLAIRIVGRMHAEIYAAPKKWWPVHWIISLLFDRRHKRRYKSLLEESFDKRKSRWIDLPR